MIKKVLKNFVCISLLLCTIFYVASPYLVLAKEDNKTTLKDLKDELTALQNKKKNYDNEKAASQKEKEQKNREIANSHKEIEEAEKKITYAKNKIEELNVKISEFTEQTKELLKFYQKLMDKNAYLEFITDSSSMTEMIMRKDAVERLADYNQKKLVELEEMIKENEKLQVEMHKYEKEQEEKIVKYEQQIKTINSNIVQLADLSMDINTEIKTQKELIEMYEKLGCKDNDILSVCSVSSTNTTWLKPVKSGIITSLFGYRTLNGSTSYHSGIDIGVAEGTAVYSATNGKVVSIVRKSSCGGNQIYIQSVVNGTTYTMLYAHLLSINVSVGDNVTNQTIIAKSGGGSTAKSRGGYDSCTYGAHLHYSVSKTSYKSWSTFMAHLINPPGFPGKGSRFYSRVQWFN